MSWTHHHGTEQIMIHTCHSIEIGRCSSVGIRPHKKVHFTSKVMFSCSCRLLPLSLWYEINCTTINDTVATINSSIRWLYISSSVFNRHRTSASVDVTYWYATTWPSRTHRVHRSSQLLAYRTRRRRTSLSYRPHSRSYPRWIQLLTSVLVRILPVRVPSAEFFVVPSSTYRWPPWTPKEVLPAWSSRRGNRQHTSHCVLLLSFWSRRKSVPLVTFPTSNSHIPFQPHRRICFFDRSELSMTSVPLFPSNLSSKIMLDSCWNLEQDHALRGGQCADIPRNITVRSSAAACDLRHLCAPSSYPSRDTDEKSHVLMFIVISRVHPYCTMLLTEYPRSEEEGVCGQLVRSIYGLRETSMNFKRIKSWANLVSAATCWLPTSWCIVQGTCMHVCTETTSWSGMRRELYDFFVPDREMCVRWYVWTVSSDGLHRRADVLQPSRSRQMRGILNSWIINWIFKVQNRRPRQKSRARAPTLILGYLWKSTSRFGQCAWVQATCLRTAPTWGFACKGIVRLMSDMCKAGWAGWDKLKRLGRYFDREWRDRIRHATFCRWVIRRSPDVWERGDRQRATSDGSEWYDQAHAACAVLGPENLCRDIRRDLADHIQGKASRARDIGKWTKSDTRTHERWRPGTHRRERFCLRGRRTRRFRASSERNTSSKQRCGSMWLQ